jgi:hypothetical protein
MRAVLNPRDDMLRRHGHRAGCDASAFAKSAGTAARGVMEFREKRAFYNREHSRWLWRQACGSVRTR